MADLPRPPGSWWQQLSALLLAVGLVSAPVITFRPPGWLGVLLLVLLGLLLLYGTVVRLCPAVELPPNTRWLLDHPGRFESFVQLNKALTVEVDHEGGTRRKTTLSYNQRVRNIGKDSLHQLEFPMLADIPLYTGDIQVRATVDDQREITFAPELSAAYAWTLSLPMRAGGLSPGGQADIAFSYSHDAFARVDADTWFVDLRSVAEGGEITVALYFPSDLREGATAYVLRRWGLCKRRVPLGVADVHTDPSSDKLTVRYIKRRSDVLLAVDTRWHAFESKA